MPPSSRVGGLAFLGQPPCCSLCTVRGGASPWSRFQSNGLPCPLRLTLAPLPLTHGPEFLLLFSPYTHAHTHTHTHTCTRRAVLQSRLGSPWLTSDHMVLCIPGPSWPSWGKRTCLGLCCCQRPTDSCTLGSRSPAAPCSLPWRIPP